jgi:DNA-binding PadR family transcriptional regulator
VKVLSLFVNSPDREIYGLQVVGEAEIPSGSLYPILHLLERIEVIVGAWENVETAAKERHRPRKKYKLNPDQAERAQDLISEAKHAQKASARSLEPRIA